MATGAIEWRVGRIGALRQPWRMDMHPVPANLIVAVVAPRARVMGQAPGMARPQGPVRAEATFRDTRRPDPVPVFDPIE